MGDTFTIIYLCRLYIGGMFHTYFVHHWLVRSGRWASLSALSLKNAPTLCVLDTGVTGFGSASAGHFLRDSWGTSFIFWNGQNPSLFTDHGGLKFFSHLGKTEPSNICTSEEPIKARSLAPEKPSFFWTGSNSRSGRRRFWFVSIWVPAFWALGWIESWKYQVHQSTSKYIKVHQAPSNRW